MSEMLVIGIGYLVFGFILWTLAYENGKLKELVKQKEAEIKQLKRAMWDRD